MSNVMSFLIRSKKIYCFFYILLVLMMEYSSKTFCFQVLNILIFYHILKTFSVSLGRTDLALKLTVRIKLIT